MKRKKFWVTLSLLNLCIVALLGFVLRSKFLFPIPYIDYKNMLNAHSHFAFGGWLTLILMILFVDSLLNEIQKQKNIYQFMLGGIALTSYGMLFTFSFQGYALFSIIFSTLFIFFTYAFSWVFIVDIRKEKKERPVVWLSTAALISLVVSSVGPFTLAYMMATRTGDPILFRDAIYTFLHFQYNGFFTLSIFALYFNYIYPRLSVFSQKKLSAFAILLISSIVPTLFLTMLWHGHNPVIRGIAILGCTLIIITLILFFWLIFMMKKTILFSSPLANSLLLFSLFSFVIKMLLQMGTLIPSLGNAVFGFRPIIIGFLHLVFLGMITFYILAHLLQSFNLIIEKRFVQIAVSFFASAIILNEAILLVEGIGLLYYVTHPVYPKLLWLASIMLFVGAVFVFIARIISLKQRSEVPIA